MDLLILLAIHNSSITIKNIEKFELGGSVTQIEKKFQPIVQFAFIEEIEKNVFDTSSQKFLCNSNVWLLKELQRLSMDSQYHEKIVGAYKRIITSIIIANSQNKPKQRREIAKYIKFDEINDIFSNSAGGARKLIDKIYESLFGLLNDNFQYFHQRAKSLSWRDGDIDSLNNALRFIKKAKNDIEVYYSSSYKEKPAYKHVCYTQAVIYVKIAKHNHFDDIQKNNMAIKAITDAFYDNENINYIESDNERGVPNDIVGFIKRVHYSRKFSEDIIKKSEKTLAITTQLVDLNKIKKASVILGKNSLIENNDNLDIQATQEAGQLSLIIAKIGRIRIMDSFQKIRVVSADPENKRLVQELKKDTGKSMYLYDLNDDFTYRKDK